MGTSKLHVAQTGIYGLSKKPRVREQQKEKFQPLKTAKRACIESSSFSRKISNKFWLLQKKVHNKF